jgi:hypothetical protein
MTGDTISAAATVLAVSTPFLIVAFVAAAVGFGVWRIIKRLRRR